MRQRLPAFSALACALFLFGCANTRLSQEPGLVSSWNKTSQPETSASIGVVLYTRQLRFDSPVGKFFGPHWSKRSTQNRLDAVLKEFPAFAAEEVLRPKPYRLVIEATHSTGGNKRKSKISSFTKYIFPCTEESAVELEGRLFKDGQLIKTFEAVGKYRTKKQLLWLLVPFKWRLGVPGDTTADTFRDLFIQVEQDAAV